MDTTNPKIYSAVESSVLPRARLRIWAFLVFVALVAITHLPFAPVEFSADDYLLRAMLRGDQALTEIGFQHASSDRSFVERITDTFHFFRADVGSLEAQRNYGNLPWWSVTEGSMHPFRPLAAITHWIDFQWWPNDRMMMQTHSFLYFMLFVAVAFSFYQRMTTQWPLAMIATGLLAYDISVALNYNWLSARNTYISVGLGMLAIYCYMAWREHGRWHHWLGACTGFMGALLSAEAGLATAGYLGAYALVYDKRGWMRGMLSLLPFIAIVILWRLEYSAGGFGASNIGLYLDPGRDPFSMVERVLIVFPQIVVSMATGADGLISGVDAPYRGWLSAACWGFVALFVYTVADILKSNREARFLFVGSVFAAIPHCSLLSGGSRNGTFVAIGFFFVLALWCAQLLQRRNERWKRGLGAGLLGLHLVLPFAIQASTTWHILPVTFTEDATYPASMKAPDARQISVVYVNSKATNLLYYFPYQWSKEGKGLPQQIQALAPGLSSIYLTRKSQRVLEIRSPAGLVLHQDSALLQENLEPAPVFSKLHGQRILSGLVTTPDDDYSQGRVFNGAGMKITLLEVRNKRVTRVRIEMQDEEPLDHKQWMAYDWKANAYKSIETPEIGKTLYFPGPLDI